ncbi:MAG TPA: hypothetical protein PLU54_10075, partial [Deltaproteobacteria bacterium]|nr:hypothetical protein [Deltaproteobacteria bacterium]
TAYDFSGNESPYSAEQSVRIPGGDPDASGSVIGGIADAISDAVDSAAEWLEQLVRNLFGLDPETPVYALGDFSDVDTPAADEEPRTLVTRESLNGGASLQSALCGLYPVRDMILETGLTYDLSTLYPVGAYLFYPLEDDSPDIDGDTILAETGGMFLYVVFDETCSVDHLLRLSAAEEIFEIRAYDPAVSQIVEDAISGIAIELPREATPGTTPVAIGWGGEDVFPGSTVLGDNEEYTIFFDILPYGLALQAPALVSMPTDWEGARVQWYDDEQQAWVDLKDVQVKDGLLSFSAQTLGRFKAAPAGAAEEEAAVPEAEPYQGRDTSCFMGAAQGPSCMRILSVLGATVLGLASCLPGMSR